jgi:hypothetical protein
MHNITIKLTPTLRIITAPEKTGPGRWRLERWQADPKWYPDAAIDNPEGEWVTTSELSALEIMAHLRTASKMLEEVAAEIGFQLSEDTL